jgi:hypothetical protein
MTCVTVCINAFLDFRIICLKLILTAVYPKAELADKMDLYGIHQSAAEEIK